MLPVWWCYCTGFCFAHYPGQKFFYFEFSFIFSYCPFKKFKMRPSIHDLSNFIHLLRFLPYHWLSFHPLWLGIIHKRCLEVWGIEYFNLLCEVKSSNQFNPYRWSESLTQNIFVVVFVWLSVISHPSEMENFIII